MFQYSREHVIDNKNCCQSRVPFFPPFSSIHTLSIPLPISLVRYHVSLHFLLHSFFFTLITGVALSALLNYIGYVCLSLSYLPIFYLSDEALSLPLSLTTR